MTRGYVLFPWYRRFLCLALLVATMMVGAGLAFAQSGPKNITLAKDHARQKWAMLVGVNKYNELKSLAYAQEDVEELGRRLVKAGFPASNVILLSNDAKEPKYQPFRTNIERQLELLAGTVGEEDLVLVAFSGHGTHIDGASYLCAAEARVEDPKGTMVELDLVYRRLSQCKARWKLLLVDACRNDPRPSGVKDSGSYEKSAGGFAKSLEKPPQGILALTSCAPGEVSLEADEFHHGVFMNYVLEGLSGKADRESGNRNGQVSLLELYGYASMQTKLYVMRKYNRAQKPTLRGEIPEDYEITSALPDPAVLALVAEGDEHFVNNRYEQAMAAYSRAIELDPKHIPAYDGRGRAKYRRRDYSGAILDHTSAIQLGPQAVSLAYRASAYRGAKELEKAKADVEEAIRLDRTCVQAHVSSSNVLVDQGLAAEALAEANEAIRLDPKCSLAYNNRGIAYNSQKEHAKAIVDYDEAIRLDPKYASAYSNRGNVYRSQKDYAKAIAEYTEAIRLDAKHVLAYNGRGIAYGNQKEYAKAMADFNEAIRLDPKYASGYGNRGNVYARLKEYSKAVADFSEVIRLDPRHPAGYNSRGNAYSDQKDYAKAIADYTEAIRLDPKCVQAYRQRAKLYRAEGSAAEAEADERKAEELQRNTNR